MSKYFFSWHSRDSGLISGGLLPILGFLCLFFSLNLTYNQNIPQEAGCFFVLFDETIILFLSSFFSDIVWSAAPVHRHFQRGGQ